MEEGSHTQADQWIYFVGMLS